MSTVNLCEVATILIRHGRDPVAVLDPLRAQVAIEVFTDATTAAALDPRVSATGLTLGDRACLALAQRLGAPAVTAEHAWTNLNITIDTIRSRRPWTHRPAVAPTASRERHKPANAVCAQSCCRR